MGLIACEGAYYARGYLVMVEQDQLLPRSGYQEFFAARKGVYRIAPLQRSSINYGWAAPMGLQLATGYDSYNYDHYQQYVDLLRWGAVRPAGARVWTDIQTVARLDMLDALNVRYLVSRHAVELPRGRFVLAAHLLDQPFFEFYKGFTRGELYIYENLQALPRAFFASRTVFARNEDEGRALLASTNLRDTAVVETAGGNDGALGSPDDRVEIREARDGYLELDTRARRARYLVVSEIWNPGWRATIDGLDLPLHKTDGALMGAWVAPGGHRLIWRFRPRGWELGLAITMLSAVITAVLAGMLLWTRQARA